MNPQPIRIAVLMYDDFSSLEFAALYEPIARQASENPARLQIEACARSTEVYDSQNLHHYATRKCDSLAPYDLIAVPGGPGAAAHAANPDFVAWLATARKDARLVTVGTGALLLAAAGLLDGKRAAALPGLDRELQRRGVAPSSERVVIDGAACSAVDARAALDLGQALAGSLASGKPLQVIAGASGVTPSRRVVVERKTNETEIKISLNLDGSGKNNIQTGLPFLDHMLTQVAVHGLFDLEIAAQGDLHIDPHHTMEDTALTLGEAFRQALGDRAGIVRMASFETPMDETLAAVTLDFSGRPYCVFHGEWTLPSVGGLPNTLFVHFFESFAQAARCNLHLRILYGRDDHHKAEALFKALGRAACAASRTDLRRSGAIPSSKGVIA